MRFLSRRAPTPVLFSVAQFHGNSSIVSNHASSPASTLWFIKVVCTLCIRNLRFLDADYFREHLTPYVASEVVSHVNTRLNKPDLAFSFFQCARLSLKLIHLEFTFHLLLKSLCRRGLHGSAKLVFDYMKDDVISPSSSDLDFLVSSFAVVGEFRVAQEILIARGEFCSEKEEVVSSYVYNNYLNFLVGRNLVDEAVIFFRDHILRLRSFRPDTCSFNIVIRGLCHKGMVEEAFEFFVVMRKFECEPDVVTFNTLINGLCRVGNMDRAKELLSELKFNYGLFPDVVTYTSVISGLCKAARMDGAETLFDEMINDAGIRPNSFTYNALIDGFGKKGDFASAHKIYERMVSAGVHPDVVTFSSLIEGHCRNGEVDQGMVLLHEMNQRKVSPNLFTFSILISALCRGNRLNEARDLLKQMNWRADIVPRPFVYNPIIDGFCKAGNVDEANLIVAEMEAKGCVHDKMTFTILILGHCMKGRMHEAIAVYEKMLSVGCLPDHITVKSLISCLRKAGMAHEANEIEHKVMSSQKPTLSESEQNENVTVAA